MQGYTPTDQWIHLACQPLAKLNRTYVPSRDDDSHTNLYFDPIGNRIYGRWIKTDDGEVIGAINLSNWAFELLAQDLGLISDFSLEGVSTYTLEQDIQSELSDVGLDPAGFTEPLHFEITKYPFADNAFPGLEDLSPSLWSQVRAAGNTACMQFLGHLQGESEIRIWPHHFDTGVYVQKTSKLGLGFGLAMEDTMAGAPYLYVAGYSSEPLVYDNLTDLSVGRWEVGEHWNGAILPLDSGLSRDSFQVFISETAGWFMSQL